MFRFAVACQLQKIQVLARWIVRSFLAIAAAGVDKASAYLLRDVVDENDPYASVTYSTSGLVTEKGDWTPKISRYYVYTLRNT